MDIGEDEEILVHHQLHVIDDLIQLLPGEGNKTEIIRPCVVVDTEHFFLADVSLRFFHVSKVTPFFSTMRLEITVSASSTLWDANGTSKDM